VDHGHLAGPPRKPAAPGLNTSTSLPDHFDPMAVYDTVRS
jgi:hypothetical protein